jgi:L-arabinonolactonase
VKPLHILPVENKLGEGVLWDARTQTAYWTDILSSKIWQWNGSDGPTAHDLPQRLGSFALTDTPGTFIGAFEDGFARFTPAAGTFEMLAPVTEAHAHLRMNDGRVDRSGTFWAGSMVQSKGRPHGSLWRYDSGVRATPFFDDIIIPNSLCWSRDGTKMYFTDTVRQIIRSYAFDAALGPVGEPDVFATTTGQRFPDGSCIDSEDHLWNAQWGAGEVVRYHPDGSIERCIPLPVSQPSCVAFGGADLNLLFVTTARFDFTPDQLANQPLAGALFVFETDVTGLPENICTRC